MPTRTSPPATAPPPPPISSASLITPASSGIVGLVLSLTSASLAPTPFKLETPPAPMPTPLASAPSPPTKISSLSGKTPTPKSPSSSPPNPNSPNSNNPSLHLRWHPESHLLRARSHYSQLRVPLTVIPNPLLARRLRRARAREGSALPRD